MMLEPSLRINRMIVVQGDRIAYDQKFHEGLNILHGDNAAGKTSIADLLCFGLGGDIINWRAEASQCTEVLLEVVLNNAIVSLKREITSEQRRPMGIHWGRLDPSAIRSEQWEVYPYAHAGSKTSFSNVLFAAMKIPEVRGSMASRITMHQLLRLAYVDQMTPTSEIFRHEAFDSDLVRDAVGALLCGVYDAEFYEIEAELRAVSAEYSGVNGQIRLAQEIIGENVTSALLMSQLQRAEAERTKLYDDIKEKETQKWTAGRLSAKQQKEVDALADKLHGLAKRGADMTSRREHLLLEIADSDLFIRSLRNHLNALDESSVLRDALGSAKFDICPACYAQLSTPPSNDHCYLCRSPLVDDNAGAYVARLRGELEQQIAESNLLQRKRQDKLKKAEAELAEVEVESKQYRLRYASLALIVSASPDNAISETNRRIGYADRQIEDIRRKVELANSLAELKQKADSLKDRIRQLERHKDEHHSRREERAFEANSMVASTTLRLLEQDLSRETIFRTGKNFQFSFAKNVMLLEGRGNFAASSMVYLKNSFHVALLMASVQLPYFKYPRFLLLDNTEDKGMEAERSHNFQELVAGWSDSAQISHQIIMTTSAISPKLKQPKYDVGGYYDDRKTLRVKEISGATSPRE